MLNDRAILAGAKFGILVGFFVGFFRAHQIKGLFGRAPVNTIRTQIDNLMTDPVAQGIEEGKAVARRHLNP